MLAVATPGAQGQAGTAGTAPVLTVPVPGVVEKVSTVPDEDGFDVVDLLVPDSGAIGLAEQASTGQIALIITHRSP